MIVNVLKKPESYEYDYGDELEPRRFKYNPEDEKQSNYDYDRMLEIGIDELFYWYSNGDYEGVGHAIFKKNDIYCHVSLCHCSCYWSFDEIEDGLNFLPYEELINSFSEELKEECSTIIEAIQKGDKNDR